MPTIKHKKVSAKGDLSNSSLVRPSDWNNDHDILTVGSSVYLGQTATGPGPVKELPIVAAPGDDYTMWTKAAIQAALTEAMIAARLFATGDVVASLAPSKPGGWILCNGQGLHISNGTTNHALFVMLWGFDGNTWPVIPSRGASAEADWTAGKVVNVPDMRGCVLGMVDTSSLVNPLIIQLGHKSGDDTVSLTVPNLPTHTHAVPAKIGAGPTILTGVGGRSEDLTNDGTSGATGGDPAASPAFAVPVPVNVTQPTMATNFFIKL